MTDERDRRGPPQTAGEIVQRIRDKNPGRRVTDAGGVPNLVERMSAKPIRIPPRLPSVSGELPKPPPRPKSSTAGELLAALIPAGVAPPDASQQFEDKTGVHELQQLVAQHPSLAPLAPPLTRLLNRSREGAVADLGIVTLIRDVLETNRQRDEAEKERERVAEAERRKSRATFWLSLVGAIAPTLLALAALIAALRGGISTPAVPPAAATGQGSR